MLYRLLSPLAVILLVNGQTDEWWPTATLYQVYPRSLKDTNGDGVGDIKGITESIPHLIDAGIDCVWLSPIYKSPMKDFGYDISDFLSIDPIFGTWDDFLELARVIKEAGLRLVMDIVPNHTSDKHDWFLKSINREDPYTDYYIWRDSLGIDQNGTQIPPNNWISAFAGSTWEWNEQRQQFYLHQFTVAQPDLDYRNPLVIEEMKNVLRFWLENGMDGFRVDAPGHIVEHIDFLDEPPTNDPNCPPMQFCQLQHIYTMNQPETLDVLREFRKVIEEYEVASGEKKVIMSEPTNNIVDTMSFYGTPDDPLMDFPFNVNFVFDINNQTNASTLKYAIDNWIDNMPAHATANWVMGNHDQPRNRERQGEEFAMALSMVNLLLPGISITYYGEEINMDNTFVSWADTQDPQGCNAGPEYYQRFSRDPERTPFQWNNQTFAGFTTGNSTWLPVNENYLYTNLEDQKLPNRIRSPFKIFQALTAARKTEAIITGSFEHRVLTENVFAFVREAPAATLNYLVVVNTGYAEDQANANEQFPQLPTVGTVYTSTISSNQEIGDVINLNAINLPPRGGIVITFTL
ncbi:alpha-glucosidase-like [Neocloeon triangulifer]|uniref:alpha-glucosidase-like n=1 Tax=Neocloeon triangulifer TaxID=2078957 RepID=UPI00286FA681|nr:alpha-glucosidase-like [Neocloeon triangulifer]